MSAPSKRARSVARPPSPADTGALIEIMDKHLHSAPEASHFGEVFGATSRGVHLLVTSRGTRAYACVAYPAEARSTTRALGWIGLGVLVGAAALVYADEPWLGGITACVSLAFFGSAWVARRSDRAIELASQAILHDVVDHLQS